MKAQVTRANNKKKSKGSNVDKEDTVAKASAGDDVTTEPKKPSNPDEELAEELGIEWRTTNARTLVRDIKQATGCRSTNHYRKIQQELKEKEEAKQAQEKVVAGDGAVEEQLKAL